VLLILFVETNIYHSFLCSNQIALQEMGKLKQISVEQRAQIVILHEEGQSQRNIGKFVGVSKTGVATTLKRYAETNSFTDRKRPGRPRKTSESEDRYIMMICKRDRFKTSPVITAEVRNMLSTPISANTVKRRLLSYGYVGRVAKRKPFLRAVNKRKRLLFAKQHQDWTTDHWKSVLWTDESKFELFGNKRRQVVRRKVGESHLAQCIAPSFKHGGGSVMVWGGFCYYGVGDLVKISGTMNKEDYHRILSQHAIPSGCRLIGTGFTFQQDNDPKHTSTICRNYLASKQQKAVLKVLSWPPQSPDINPIELLWDEIDRQVRKMHVTSEKTMWDSLKQVWGNLKNETLQKLVERLPRICKAIIKSRGGYFNEKTLK